jgi:hypothetical protein
VVSFAISEASRRPIRKLPGSAGTFRAGPTGSLEPLSETSYRLQLNTSQALKEKLEKARDLMSHSNRTGDLAVVVERALDLLIERLKKERFAETSRPRRKTTQAAASAGATEPLGQDSANKPAQATELGGADVHETSPIAATRAVSLEAGLGTPSQGAGAPLKSVGNGRYDRSKSSAPRKRARVANEVRRQVVARDGLRCSYVGDDGSRCRATGFLHIHHEHPWAKGGSDTIENLRLLCAHHNELLAEQEYGRQVIARAKVPA